MAWISLVFAGLFETVGVLMINKFHKDRNAMSLLYMMAGFASSFLLLAFAMRTLPMGTAYAIWTGIGASGGALLGMIFYDEPRDWKRILCIAVILSSAVGLKFIS